MLQWNMIIIVPWTKYATSTNMQNISLSQINEEFYYFYKWKKICIRHVNSLLV